MVRVASPKKGRLRARLAQLQGMLYKMESRLALLLEEIVEIECAVVDHIARDWHLLLDLPAFSELKLVIIGCSIQLFLIDSYRSLFLRTRDIG
jgi:hypothetical protein